MEWPWCWAFGSSLNSTLLGAQCLSWSPPSESPGRTEQGHLPHPGGPGGSAGATLSRSTPCRGGFTGTRAREEVLWPEPEAWLLEAAHLASGASTLRLRLLLGPWRSEVSSAVPRALATSLVQLPHPWPNSPHAHTASSPLTRPFCLQGLRGPVLTWASGLPVRGFLPRPVASLSARPQDPCPHCVFFPQHVACRVKGQKAGQGSPTIPVDALRTLERSGPAPRVAPNCCCPDLKHVLLAGWTHPRLAQRPWRAL